MRGRPEIFIYRHTYCSPMRVFIMTDLEGASGVAGYWDDFNPGGRIHEEARRMLTRDVNAAVEGALRGGAEEVVVLDGHGAGFSILLEELDPSAQLIRGRRILEMEGLDDSFDCVLAVGVHAAAGTPLALLCHTLSSTSIVSIKVNGVEVGEVGLWSMISGHYGVPLIMASGDKAGVEEAKALLGNIEGVVVKEATSMYAARCLHPKVTYKLISNAAERALERLRSGDFRAFALGEPVVMEVTYMLPSTAESVSRRPGVERVGGRTVRCACSDILECMSRLL